MVPTGIFRVGRHVLPPTGLPAPDESVPVSGATAVIGDKSVVALILVLAASDTVVAAAPPATARVVS